MIAVSLRRAVRSGSAAGAGLLIAVALGGCSSEDDTPDSQEPESSVSPSASEEEQTILPPADPDEEAVLAAYQGYWDEYARAVSEDSLEDYVQAISDDTIGQTPLADHTASDAQVAVLEHVRNLADAGWFMTGAPERMSPEVASMDLSADVPTAQVTDCLNIEDWLQWDRETGEQVPNAEGWVPQYSLTATVEQWGGTWRVTGAAPDADSTC